MDNLYKWIDDRLSFERVRHRTLMNLTLSAKCAQRGSVVLDVESSLMNGTATFPFLLIRPGLPPSLSPSTPHFTLVRFLPYLYRFSHCSSVTLSKLPAIIRCLRTLSNLRSFLYRPTSSDSYGRLSEVVALLRVICPLPCLLCW